MFYYSIQITFSLGNLNHCHVFECTLRVLFSILNQDLFKKGNVHISIQNKIIFPPFWFLIQKLDHNSGLQAKNQRKIFSYKVRRHHRPFGGGNGGREIV